MKSEIQTPCDLSSSDEGVRLEVVTTYLSLHAFLKVRCRCDDDMVVCVVESD
jgi:hypothetical protein